MLHGGRPDLALVGTSAFSFGCIANHIDRFVFQMVDQIGMAVHEFLDAYHRNSDLFQPSGGTTGRQNLESEFVQVASHFDGSFLGPIGHTDEYAARLRQDDSGTQQTLGVSD